LFSSNQIFTVLLKELIKIEEKWVLLSYLIIFIDMNLILGPLEWDHTFDARKFFTFYVYGRMKEFKFKKYEKILKKKF
jgi:hypothetical protein